DAATYAVDQVDERNAIARGEILDEAALPALAASTAGARAAFDRVVFATHRHRTAVDLADTGDIRMGHERKQLAVLTVLSMAGELADFLKAAGIQQSGDALAHGELAFGVVPRHRLGSAAGFRQASPTVKLLDLCRPAHIKSLIIKVF